LLCESLLSTQYTFHAIKDAITSAKQEG